MPAPQKPDHITTEELASYDEEANEIMLIHLPRFHQLAAQNRQARANSEVKSEKHKLEVDGLRDACRDDLHKLYINIEQKLNGQKEIAWLGSYLDEKIWTKLNDEDLYFEMDQDGGEEPDQDDESGYASGRVDETDQNNESSQGNGNGQVNGHSQLNEHGQ
jgi:hypothetical protein